MTVIYRIIAAADWAAAQAAGAFAGTAHDIRDGFIHFSTAAQAAETAAKHYAGQDNLVLVAASVAALGEKLKWEHSTTRGEDFPHLFASLSPDAIKWARPITRDSAGTFLLPPLD